jgi:superfamily I DNA/RNA helicase
MTFKPSQYQQDIFDFVQKENRSGIIEAVAGSGKTTTIVKALELIPSNKYVLFLAFNKAIAEELKSRVPSHVRAATFHSVGFGVWRKGKDNIKIDPKKTWSLIREHLGETDQDLYGTFIFKMIGLAKGAGVGYLIPNDLAAWFRLADHYDVYLDSADANEQRGMELSQFILQKSIEAADQVIDYDDMLYMPLIKNMHFWQYHFVFVDEAQDTNPIQVALLKRMLKPGGRLIAVGDPHQAIYGFRGADSAAMNRIKEEFACIKLPLSVSYRCPQAVVKAAQKYVSHIEAHEDAPIGRVGQVPPEFRLQDFKSNDAILCRNTAPLVNMAFTLLRNRIPCRLLGREIGSGLSSLVKKMKAKTINGLIDRLENYKDREIAKYVSKGQEEKAQVVEDKVLSLLTIIENLPENQRTVPALIKAIEDLFTDNGQGFLTLSTVHKAKGLEWERVYILAPNLMPSKWARKEWQMQQEINLIYVAYTRAKRELFFY